jgi:pilus assembly protein CpaF
MSLSKRLNPDSTADSISYPQLKESSKKKPQSELTNYGFEELKDQAISALIESLGQQLYADTLDERILVGVIHDTVAQIIQNSNLSLTTLDRANISQLIVDEILGLGPLQSLLRDPEITEIMVNGPNEIFVEREGKLYKTKLKFISEQHLRQIIDRIVHQVGRRIDESSPMVDARLPDGSRINAVIPPIALDGSCLTIRKFSEMPFSKLDLISFGTVSSEALEFIGACVESKFNVVISGGTGSGKTTTLNVLASFIGTTERVITIEDAAELRLNQSHVLRLESRPSNSEGAGIISIRDLVRNALRMRPDRIVVGEVRDAAALDMLQAMNTGHEGSITTVHANSSRDALMRLETMVLMAGVDLPVRVVREQIAQAIDLVIQQSRMPDGSRKITQISEITGIDGDVIQMQDLFTMDVNLKIDSKIEGVLEATGVQLQKKLISKKVKNNNV